MVPYCMFYALGLHQLFMLLVALTYSSYSLLKETHNHQIKQFLGDFIRLQISNIFGGPLGLLGDLVSWLCCVGGFVCLVFCVSQNSCCTKATSPGDCS